MVSRLHVLYNPRYIERVSCRTEFVGACTSSCLPGGFTGQLGPVTPPGIQDARAGYQPIEIVQECIVITDELTFLRRRCGVSSGS
jgi:hypothetical protein